MAKGKFKHKPTGERSPEEIAAGTSAGRPRTFNKIGKTTDISRREREELEKQKSHDSRMKCQEQGKTEQARKVLEAAKKREEEKVDMESASRADNALLNEKGKNKMDYKSLQNEAESLRTKLQHVDSKSAQVDLLHGSDDKSNPDVVALEQTKLSGREDQTGSS